ncbi:MAG: AfsR/SARP family transcriptional regulator, partial [Candidatus Limnocylindrales bacterium]
LGQALEAGDDPGALVGAAEVLITMGRCDEALTVFLRAKALSARVPHTPAVRTDMALIEQRISLASAHAGRDGRLGATRGVAPIGISAGARALTFDAIEAHATGSPDAAELAKEGLTTSLADGATHWERRIRVVDAAARGSAADLRAAITDAARLGRMALPDAADTVVAVLDLLDPAPIEVEESIAAWPDRWLPLLRHRLEAGLDKRSLAAAQLLSRFGTDADVPRLKAWERRHIRRTKALRLGRQLAMRTSPRLVIHDLGAARLERGNRLVGLTDVRRRAATLLMYLVARPGRVALREQVLEDIWPDLDPPAATNSLNQTLYFVRRDIEPGYDEAVSVNYVLYEGDLLRLEPELVQVDSWTFQERATSRESRQASTDECLAIVETYDGPFAPVFAYEDWAIDWREQVHTSYLDLVNRTQLRLMDAGRVTEAIALTQRALGIDPKAIDLERSLVWLYSAAGSRSAAAEQYRHYAAAHREELGVEASSFHTLIGEGLTPPP